jgi:hypothetical protein
MVLVTNPAPVTYQWRRNGTNLPGADATSPVYTLLQSNITNDNNQTYSCVISNSSGSVTSSPALLTVTADTTPPICTRAIYQNPTNVLLLFSEPLLPASATNISNYVFTNGLPVLAALLRTDNQSVTLVTAPMALGNNFVVVLNGLKDRASTPNTITPNTQVTFVAGGYAPQAIGNPLPLGSIAADGNGYDMAGGGNVIGGTNDQFQFAWQPAIGDFDVAVRLNYFSQSDPFAQAGLMAREDLTPRSRFAAILATPSINGVYFETRPVVSGPTSSVGNVRANYPHTWLRLRRSAGLFTGFASYDGVTWQQLGSVSVTLNDPIYLGMAVCSHTSSQTAMVQFATWAVSPMPRPGSSPTRANCSVPQVAKPPLR